VKCDAKGILVSE
jgi:hypothetical protein